MERVEVERFQSCEVSLGRYLRRFHHRQFQNQPIAAARATHGTQEQGHNGLRVHLAIRFLQMTPRGDQLVHPSRPDLETSVSQTLGILSIPKDLFLHQAILQCDISRYGEFSVRNLQRKSSEERGGGQEGRKVCQGMRDGRGRWVCWWEEKRERSEQESVL